MISQATVLLLLQISIIGTVLSYGLRATVSDALYLARHPGLLLRSVLAMFVVMPLIAIAIVELFPLPKATEIALVALSISPIPPLLPKKEGKAGGDGGYALGLMVVMGLMAIVIVPLQVTLLGTYFDRSFDISAAAIAKVIVYMIVLPLLVGMVVRAARPELAAKLAKLASMAALILLVAMVALVLYAVMPAVLKLIGNGTVIAVVAFIALGLVVGHLLAGRTPDRQTVLSLSTASRHPAIALAIAKTNFPDEQFLGASIVLYLLVVTLMAIPYVLWRARSVQKSG